jgi:N-acetylmuramoyl-L-alanine amidase
MMVRVVLTVLALVIVAATGCVGPGRVVEDLPPPIMKSPSGQDGLKAPSQPRRRRDWRPGLPQIGPVTIVVDAGHGGKDPGAQGRSRLPEKTINLLIAQEVAQRLDRLGARVVTTRPDDQFVDLDRRADIAGRTRADLFISIHADAAKRESVAGATMYIARKASGASHQAAQCLQSAFRTSGIPCRGIGRANFRVLVGHPRPAVLIETGFLTNGRESWLLGTPKYRSQVADAIVLGVAKYFAAR